MTKETFLTYLGEIVKHGNWIHVENFEFWKAIAYCYANAEFYLEKCNHESILNYVCSMGNFEFKTIKSQFEI